MTAGPEKTITERIEGGCDVFLGSIFVGIVEEKDGAFLGTLNGGPPADGREISGEDLESCAASLIAAHEVQGRPFWEVREAGRAPGGKRRKVKPRLIRGRKIRSLRELVTVLQTSPSVWWKGGARSSAFVLSQQLRTIDKSMRSPNPAAGFFRIQRQQKEDT